MAPSGGEDYFDWRDWSIDRYDDILGDLTFRVPHVDAVDPDLVTQTDGGQEASGNDREIEVNSG